MATRRMLPMLLGLLALVSNTVAQDLEACTYRLTQSTGQYCFWTTPATRKVYKDSPAPVDTSSRLSVYAARNEFEPIQIVVLPGSSGPVTVTAPDFGTGITVDCAQVKYVPVTTASDQLGRTGDCPDPLWPLEDGASVSLTANENTSFWLTVAVPPSTAAGDHSAQVVIGGVAIPVTLHVFDFALPDELHVASQMNLSYQAILNAYGVSGTGDEYWTYVRAIKQFMIDRRLTPKNPLWPGGLTTGGGAPYIDYDCNAHTLTDSYGAWGFEQQADTNLNGTGFNDGAGFPTHMGITFANNDPSADQRPATFCGHTRSAVDWYVANNPNTAYNMAWFSYIGELAGYLSSLELLDKTYYYVANEPQDQADYDAVAWYTGQLKQAAPGLRLMVSEEPRSEIYANPSHPNGKVDIWLPVLQNLDPAVAADRFLNHDEQTWVYFLSSTRPPYPNPITIDHAGMESRLIGWLLWKYRLRGITYYSTNNWAQNPWTNPAANGHNGELFLMYPPSESGTPIAYGSNGHRLVSSIRLELLREGLEDYEYCYLLSGGAHPVPGTPDAADVQVNKVITSLTAYTHDDDFVSNLRRLIGRKLGGEISSIPDIHPVSNHPRAQAEPGDYFMNFQDPTGEPLADPLVVNGHTYEKIGWTLYDTTFGYGWRGNTTQGHYHYATAPNALQGSIIYDDYGRPNTFEYDLPAGTYDVTVSVGWPGRTYAHNRVVVEGVALIDDEESSPYLERTARVLIADNRLTLEIGMTGQYTMLNYLEARAYEPPTAAHLPAAAASREPVSLRVLPGLRQVVVSIGDAPGGAVAFLCDIHGRRVGAPVRTGRGPTLRISTAALAPGRYTCVVTRDGHAVVAGAVLVVR